MWMTYIKSYISRSSGNNFSCGEKGYIVTWYNNGGTKVYTLRKDFVILQLYWWSFSSTKHCS